LRGNQRRDAGRSSRIPAQRFQNDTGLAQANLFELLGNEEAVMVIGDDASTTEDRSRKPATSLLKQTFRPDELVELLGEGLPGNRPKSGAGATTQDKWRDPSHVY
jgi:hypothetical protein